MIETRIGNMLTLAEDADVPENVARAFAHGTNCQGRMGSGIAWTIRHLFPEVYDVYMKEHEENGLYLGGTTAVHLDDGFQRAFFNCNTQDAYRRFKHQNGFVEPDNKVFVDYDAVEACFKQINDAMLMKLTLLNIDTVEVHFPLIGAGLANGEWDRIESIIDSTLDDKITKVLWKLEK